jgi:6-pyruvoyltetrahydropterin/6-carboxytetrahydropterin synthase
MSKWSIHKTIDFCYGHRTYTQQLNGEFSSDLRQACRHFHGHEGSINVYLEADTLDHTGMVTDFRHLEWAKKFINEHIDHQFIMDINDPLFEQFVLTSYNKLRVDNNMTVASNKYDFYENATIALVVPETDHVVGYKPDLDWAEHLKHTPEYEAAEGITIVDFVPTSENLSKWMAEMIQAKMSRIGVKVARLDWYETPRSCSSYIAE